MTYLPYENRERVAGESSWNFWNLYGYSVEGFINFSDAPLNLSIWSGLLSFLFSVLGVIFVVIRKLTIGGSVTGWASMIYL